MAVKKSAATQAPAAATNGAERQTKATLGFLNIGIQTAQGGVIRIDAVRLLEGHKVHEQVAQGLNMQRPGDDKLSPAERDAEKLKRLENFVKLLDITFNPTRTDEESKVALF